MVEVIAAVIGALVGVTGTGAAMSWAGSSRRNTESREAVIELTAAVKSIAGKLDELHQDMKVDRREVYARLNDHGNRIAILENKVS